MILTLLIDSFLSSFLVPMGSDGVWTAWATFGREDVYLVTLAAILVSSSAYLVDYWFGWVLSRDIAAFKLTQTGYARFQRVARWLPCLLLLPWLPFLPILATMIGFARTGWLTFFLAALAGRTLFYSFILYSL